MQYVFQDMTDVPEHDAETDTIQVVIKRWSTPPTYWDSATRKWTATGGPPIKLERNQAAGLPLYYDQRIDIPVIADTTTAIFTHSKFGTYGTVERKTVAQLSPRAVQISY